MVARLAAPLREASAGLLVAVFRVFFPRHSLFYLVAGHRLRYHGRSISILLFWKQSAFGGPSDIPTALTADCRRSALRCLREITPGHTDDQQPARDIFLFPYFFAGHVGRSDFLFRLEQKIGAMAEAAFIDP